MQRVVLGHIEEAGSWREGWRRIVCDAAIDDRTGNGGILGGVALRAPLLVEARGPVVVQAEFAGDHMLASDPVENKEVAVAFRRHYDLARAAVKRGVGKDRRLCGIPVVRVM